MFGLQECGIRIGRLRLALRRLCGLRQQHLLLLRVHGHVIAFRVVQAAVPQDVRQGVADVRHGHNAIRRAVSLPNAHLRLQGFPQDHGLFFVLAGAEADIDGHVSVQRPRARIDRHKLAVYPHHFLAADMLLCQPCDDPESLLHAAFGQMPGDQFGHLICRLHSGVDALRGLGLQHVGIKAHACAGYASLGSDCLIVVGDCGQDASRHAADGDFPQGRDVLCADHGADFVVQHVIHVDQLRVDHHARVIDQRHVVQHAAQK